MLCIEHNRIIGYKMRGKLCVRWKWSQQRAKGEYIYETKASKRTIYSTIRLNCFSLCTTVDWGRIAEKEGTRKYCGISVCMVICALLERIHTLVQWLRSGKWWIGKAVSTFSHIKLWLIIFLCLTDNSICWLLSLSRFVSNDIDSLHLFPRVRIDIVCSLNIQYDFPIGSL